MGVSRETLYAEVWAEPMTKVAARYGVSSNFLARVCERLHVPHPSRGHWAQLAVGKASERPALPEAEPGDELEWSRDGEPRRAPRPLPRAPARGASAPLMTRIKRPSRHPLVSGAREHFDAARVSDDGYLKPLKRCLVDVYVTREILPRALETANELFLTLQERGHRVMFAPFSERYHCADLDEREHPDGMRWQRSWRPDRPTLVFIGTVAIGLTLFEPSEHVEVKWVDGKRVRVGSPPAGRRPTPHALAGYTSKHDMPSGRLGLRAYSPYPRAPWDRQWKEDEAGKLLRRFASIAEELESAAPTIAKRVEEGERQAEVERKRAEAERLEWQRRMEEERRQEVLRRRAQAIEESRKDLLRAADAWAQARQVEAFLADAERRTVALEREADRTAAAAQLQRAREVFGRVDSLSLLRSWRRPEDR